MFPKPGAQLAPNTYAYESQPMVKPTGFREYDARWLLGQGNQPDGRAGARHGPRHADPRDGREARHRHRPRFPRLFGLGEDGADLRPDGGRLQVHDIGLALSPMAYFAQFDLDVPCVAMVTASHNDNGWTGVKMGANRPLTFGPDEMSKLKDIVLNAAFKTRDGGSYAFVDDFPARYIADLTKRPKLKRKLKVVAACGNGTAGAFAPQGAGSDRLRGDPARLRARPHLPEIQSESRRHEDAARHARRGDRCTAPMSRSASTATATAAAWSTTTATRFSPTRSA